MKRDVRPAWLIWFASIAAGIMLLAAILVFRHRKKAPQEVIPGKPGQTFIPIGMQGLTSQDVESRIKEGQSNAIDSKPDRTIRDIIRYNTLSVFNLSLIGISFTQLLLGKTIDALLSLGIIALNVSLNTLQELFAKRRLRSIQASSQEKATVIRDYKITAIIPNDIVKGDFLVIGPGDRLFADGRLVDAHQIILDESIITGKDSPDHKQVGESIFAGSYCTSGHGVYEATAVGADRKITLVSQAASTQKEQLTPIEHIIDRVLKVMLIIVTVFTLILLSRYYRFDLGIDVDLIVDAASVIFSLAPAGLFFMILLTYTGGTADLVKFGALVHRARSVELLAQVNVICFSDAGILTGTRVDLEFTDQGKTAEQLAETRIRQILGDYSRSGSYSNLVLEGIRNSFEGNTRSLQKEAPYMSIYGWSGAIFSDPDLTGTFVLGEEKILQNALIQDEIGEDPTRDLVEEKSGFRKIIGRIGKLRSRSNDGNPTPPEEPQINHTITTDKKQADEDPDQTPTNPAPRKSLWQRLKNRIPGQNKTRESIDFGKQIREQYTLLFAYSPKILPLQDTDGTQILPDDLIPLCKIYFSTQVRGDSVEALRQFKNSGIQVKIFSSKPAEEIAKLLVSAGWETNQDNTTSLINGNDLQQMDKEIYDQVIVNKQIFGQLTPSLASQIVQDLRGQGLYVSVLGDGIRDIPALRQADLAIALKSSNQVVHSTADIILLKDSPSVLYQVLSKGQRIVNGLMNILKLYLTQILYLTLLIITVQLIAFGFPYKSAQGGLISFLTLAMPSLGFSLWASAGIIHNRQLSRVLSFFVVPAGITIAVLATLVYTYFLTAYRDIEYSQLAVTYTLVIAGFLLVITLQPPLRIIRRKIKINPDQRFTLLAFVGFLVFGLLLNVPLSQKLFKIEPISGDNLSLITIAALVWLISLILLWQILGWILGRTGWLNSNNNHIH